MLIIRVCLSCLNQQSKAESKTEYMCYQKSKKKYSNDAQDGRDSLVW